MDMKAEYMKNMKKRYCYHCAKEGRLVEKCIFSEEKYSLNELRGRLTRDIDVSNSQITKSRTALNRIDVEAELRPVKEERDELIQERDDWRNESLKAEKHLDMKHDLEAKIDRMYDRSEVDLLFREIDRWKKIASERDRITNVERERIANMKSSDYICTACIRHRLELVQLDEINHMHYKCPNCLSVSSEPKTLHEFREKFILDEIEEKEQELAVLKQIVRILDNETLQ